MWSNFLRSWKRLTDINCCITLSRNFSQSSLTTMAMTTGILPCNSVLIPPKSLNSFPLLTTVRANLSWIDVTNENLRSMLFSGVRYERAKEFRAPVFSSSHAGDLRPEIDENPEGILSGEWPENFSLLSYDDLKAYLETQIASEKMKPSALLGEVMSTPIRTATADQTLEEVDHHFVIVSGLPVINENLKCIGVISRKDKAKASNGILYIWIYPNRWMVFLQMLHFFFNYTFGNLQGFLKVLMSSSNSSIVKNRSQHFKVHCHCHLKCVVCTCHR